MELKKKWNVRSAPNRLSDNQMKNVVAGYSDGGGDGYGGGSVIGTCAAISSTGTCLASCASNTKTEAIFWAGCSDTTNGKNCSGNWCCDSCSSATWFTRDCKC